MKVRIKYEVTDDYDNGDYDLEIMGCDMWCDTMKMYLPVDESVWGEFRYHIEGEMNKTFAKESRDESETAYIEAHAGEWS